MELKECITCGSHSFTDNKCDYCGNEYEVKKEAWQEKLKVAPLSDYMKSLSDEEIDDILNNLKDGLTPNQIRTVTCKEDLVKEEEEETPVFIEAFDEANKHDVFMLKFMASILGLIIWFAVCVFIPPLFLITICGLIIWVCRKVYKKY